MNPTQRIQEISNGTHWDIENGAVTFDGPVDLLEETDLLLMRVALEAWFDLHPEVIR